MNVKFLSLGLAFAGIAHAQVHQFQGSDTLAGMMTDAIIASGMDSEIRYAGGGSGLGEKALVAGAQGIAPMSREIKPEIKAQLEAQGVQVSEHRVALDGLGVFVNESNKLPTLTIAQVVEIFSCKITRWEELPASGLAGPISVYRRNDASGTTDAFKHFTGIKTFGACVTVLAETVDIAEKTANEATALAYSGLSAKRPGNRAAALQRDALALPVELNVSTVRDFSYPFARFLYVYSVSGARQMNAAEQKFMSYVADRSFLDPIVQDHEFYTLD